MMKIKPIFLVAFIFIFNNCYAKTKNLKLFTNIEFKNLYENAITNFYFSPNEFELSSNNEDGMFSPVSSTLFVESSIPVGIASITYNLNLKENSTSCIDYSGNASNVTDFSSVYIDDELLNLENSIKAITFNLNDGVFKKSKHVMSLKFKSFDNLPKSDFKFCNGKIILDIGLEL